MRSRLGYIKGKKEAWYSLKRNPQRVGKKIRKEILMEVIPVFELLNSREAILKHRREFPLFDTTGHLILLEESLIYGHLGCISQARERFCEYYQMVKREADEEVIPNGHLQYLEDMRHTLGFDK